MRKSEFLIWPPSPNFQKTFKISSYVFVKVAGYFVQVQYVDRECQLQELFAHVHVQISTGLQTEFDEGTWFRAKSNIEQIVGSCI